MCELMFLSRQRLRMLGDNGGEAALPVLLTHRGTDA